MTGEESYHAACFTCRSCHNRIEELVFAKTSQGIYCMPCHNQRVARSRRHAEAKRQKAAKEAAAAEAAKAERQRLADEQAQQQVAAASATPLSPQLASPLILQGSSPSSRRPLEAPSVGAHLRSSARSDDGMSGGRSPSPASIRSTSGRGGPYPSPQGGRDGSIRGPSPVPSLDKPLPPLGNLGQPSRSSRPGSSASDHAALPSPRLEHQRSNSSMRSVPRKAVPALETHRASSSNASASSQNSTGNGELLPSLTKGRGTETSVSTQASSSNAGLTDSNGVLGSASGSLQRDRPEPIDLSDPRMGNVEQALNSALSVIVHEAEEDAPAAKACAEAPSSGASRSPQLPEVRLPDSPLPDAAPAQVKRASVVLRPSRASVVLSNGASTANMLRPEGSGTNRLSQAFSFYDPDFINLMDSFSKFDNNDDFKLSSPGLEQLENKPASSSPRATLSPRSPRSSASRRRRTATESGDEVGRTDAESEKSRSDVEERDPKPRSRHSSMSRKEVSAKMRESIKQAKDGHVSMDMSFVENILGDLDDTRKSLRKLQKKYDRMRRASRHAAQGFSLAKEEFEQEVNARHEAELELAQLRKKIVEQATKLKDVAGEERQVEEMRKKSVEIRSSIKGMEQDLAKLDAEREVKTSELAELLAAQTGVKSASNSPRVEQSEDWSLPDISRKLSVRLEGVREKYKKQIDQLALQRDGLVAETEELTRRNAALREEGQMLSDKNDELAITLSKLTRSIESATRHLERVDRAVASRQEAKLAADASQGAALSKSATPEASPYVEAFSGHDVDSAVTQQAQGLRADPSGGAKKFKWGMKAGTARTVGPAVAAAIPVASSAVTSPPVPAKHHHASSSISFGRDNQARAAQELLIREHILQPYNIIRPVRCFACQRNMWGSEMRCTLCGHVCHSRCVGNLPSSCEHGLGHVDEAAETTEPSMFGMDLTTHLDRTGREIPIVVEHCVDAVEQSGECARGWGVLTAC